jgi:hypothetical protein
MSNWIRLTSRLQQDRSCQRYNGSNLGRLSALSQSSQLGFLPIVELGQQQLGKRPAGALPCVLHMPLNSLLRTRPVGHLMSLVPLSIHRLSFLPPRLASPRGPAFKTCGTAASKLNAKTTTASRAFAREAAAGELLGLDWRPSRFRECQSRDGIPPPGLTWGWGARASGLSHLTYETTGIVTLHQLDQPPFPCKLKLL